MSQTNHRPENKNVERRTFLKTGVAATVATAALQHNVNAADGQSNDIAPIPTRALGKNGPELPILGYGGAALPKAWGNPLSTEDRVKLVRYAFDQGVRYFDTAGNYMESEAIIGQGLRGVRSGAYLVTKVETTDPAKVRASVENSLKQLQTDYLDAILIHGTPGIEQMSVQRAMQIHAELVKLKDERIAKAIGFSSHSYYDKALELIKTDSFELCMLSHGYFLRGYNQVYSEGMLALREQCLAEAHKRGMGIVAMKVMGAGVLGAWSKNIVPGFDSKCLDLMPGAAMRYALDDQRVHVLNIGMRLKQDVDANVKTISGNMTLTPEDEAVLKDFMTIARQSNAIKKMKVD